MEGSFNSEHKLLIRENWNKPLLKFLSKRLDDKLVYLGLPSPKAEDVLTWVAYIKNVIAFQCRDYGEESKEEQDRKPVEELNDLLRQLEREGQIENYVVFDGYLEEVILRGYDNSPTRIYFNLNDFVTVYNLDFCNKITNPIEFVDENGEDKTAYKFDAITKLIEIQKSLGSMSKKFVLFLTVHCSYDGKELQDFINNPPTSEINDFIKKYNTLSGYEKSARIVRLFFSYYIKQIFESNGFIPKILPSLVYQGLGDTYLLHFTVLGIVNKNRAGVIVSYQTLNEVLTCKFISIHDNKFINKDGVGEKEVEVNPVTMFSNSITFQKAWLS